MGNAVKTKQYPVKEPEAERKRAEEVFKTLTISSPIGIYIVQDRAFQFVSPQFQKLLGYSEDELLGMDSLRPVHPEDREMVRENAIRMLKGEHSSPYEYRYISKGGQTKWVMETVASIQYRGRRATLGNFLDITERKQTEEELKLRAQILDGATDSIFVHDLDENFIYVNEAACRVHGYSREEFMKMKITQILTPERATRLASDKQEILGKGQLVVESAHLRKDGSIMPVEIHARTIESSGKKLVLVVVRDITERKRAEEERRELENRAHLTSRLASIGEMAAGIAHEINNPLTAVIGFSQLLMDTNIPDDVKKDMAVIYKEAQRAADVAKNLLIFARKREPTRQPTDINSTIREVLQLRAYEEKVNNIQVNTRFAHELPKVMADYSQLQQVFLNIIINAEAAMLEANNGGILTVTTQKVNGTIKVSFTDNGPGIAKENLERVFDPFFTTKDVGKGTGLGLSLCHGIVAQHGGKIYARSKLGKGATFVVELPINAH